MEAQLTKEEGKRIASVRAGRQKDSKKAEDKFSEQPEVPGTTLKQEHVIDVLTPLGALQQTDADRQDSLAAKPAQLTKTVHARLNMENWAERRLVTAIIRAKKAWQAVAILSILCLIATSTAAGWLFLDRQRHTYFLNRVQREHNLLVEQISSENEKLIAENAALKTRDHLLPSSITPAEASAKK